MIRSMIASILKVSTESYINLANFIVATIEVKHLRNLLALSILILLVAGCVSSPPPQAPSASNVSNCSNVTAQVPYQISNCTNVSVTSQVCGSRALPFHMVKITPIDLCVSDGTCVGLPLSQCDACSRAMTRCGVMITNDDANESGAWVVGANFTVSGGGFINNPVSKTLAPNQSYEFDFQQMYTLGTSPSSATCDVFLVSSPTVNDCHDETRMQTECTNVTVYNTTETQVCG